MAETNGEFPTVIGADARFKGELLFDKGVRIEGAFEGQIRSKGTLSIAEGAKVSATIEAANVRVEGECHGNLAVSEKLHLLATAKVQGDLRANRLEIADGAIFIGNVAVGQVAAAEAPMRRAMPAASPSPAMAEPMPMGPGPSIPRELMREMPPGMARPRPEIRVPANP